MLTFLKTPTSILATACIGPAENTNKLYSPDQISDLSPSHPKTKQKKNPWNRISYFPTYRPVIHTIYHLDCLLWTEGQLLDKIDFKLQTEETWSITMLGDDFISPHLHRRSPWYNRSGWLSAKSQVTYLFTYNLHTAHAPWSSGSLLQQNGQFTELRSYAILRCIIYYQKITEHFTHRRCPCLMIWWFPL